MDKEVKEILVGIVVGLAFLNAIPYLLPTVFSFYIGAVVIFILLLQFNDLYFSKEYGICKNVESKLPRYVYIYMTYIFLFAGNYSPTLWLEFKLREMTTDGIELFLEPGWMMLAILIITIFLADPDPDTLSEAKEDKE